MMKIPLKNNEPLLKDIAYSKIKEFIIEELFEPGSILSERELIEMFKMSKTPIKSALTKLESEGFLTVSNKQGIIIHDLSIERIVNIYDLRTALETYNCKVLCGKLANEEIEEMERNLQGTRDAVGGLDVKKFTFMDHEFHLLLCLFTDNIEVYRILQNYNDHLKRITFKHLKKDPQRMKQFLKEHEEIFQLLKEGDKRSIDVMHNHLQSSKQKLFM